MRWYNLTVQIPLDSAFTDLHLAMIDTNYTKTHWHSFIPPNKVVYEFKSIPKNKLKKLTSIFSKLYCNSIYKEVLQFNVEEIK